MSYDEIALLGLNLPTSDEIREYLAQRLGEVVSAKAVTITGL